MAADLGVGLKELIGNTALIDKIDIRKYVSETVGEPTLKDIIAELKKPGRDPRAVFEKPAFREDVTEIEHVRQGMVLEGIVTNVTAFGAFVDIGVHQDGLVHVSELADHFVRDPAEVVKAGDRLKVTVLSVDYNRKRIALSAKSKPGFSGGGDRRGPAPRPGGGDRRGDRPFTGGRRNDPPRDSRNPHSSGFSCNPFGSL